MALLLNTRASFEIGTCTPYSQTNIQELMKFANLFKTFQYNYYLKQ